MAALTSGRDRTLKRVGHSDRLGRRAGSSRIAARRQGAAGHRAGRPGRIPSRIANHQERPHVASHSRTTRGSRFADRSSPSERSSPASRSAPARQRRTRKPGPPPCVSATSESASSSASEPSTSDATTTPGTGCRPRHGSRNGEPTGTATVAVGKPVPAAGVDTARVGAGFARRRGPSAGRPRWARASSSGWRCADPGAHPGAGPPSAGSRGHPVSTAAPSPRPRLRSGPVPRDSPASHGRATHCATGIMGTCPRGGRLRRWAPWPLRPASRRRRCRTC